MGATGEGDSEGIKSQRSIYITEGLGPLHLQEEVIHLHVSIPM